MQVLASRFALTELLKVRATPRNNHLKRLAILQEVAARVHSQLVADAASSIDFVQPETVFIQVASGRLHVCVLTWAVQAAEQCGVPEDEADAVLRHLLKEVKAHPRAAVEVACRVESLKCFRRAARKRRLFASSNSRG